MSESQWAQNKVNFRERKKEKEIQPEMKYTAKSDMERIKFYLKETVQTQVDNQSIHELIKKQGKSSKKQIDLSIRIVNRK